MYVPTHDYWPMLGGYIEYLTYLTEAHYNPETHELIIDKATRYPEADWRRTNVVIDNGLFPQAVTVQTPRGIEPSADWRDDDNTLVQTTAAHPGGKGFIGETGVFSTYGFPVPGNKSRMGLPPEPIIPLDVTEYMSPITGETVGITWDKDTGAAVESRLAWRFKNFGVGTGPNNTWIWSDWYPDQVKTYLEERPDAFENDNVYKYVFARGIGPIYIASGARKADNSAPGWMMQIHHYWMP